jgi:hypothetical protein
MTAQGPDIIILDGKVFHLHSTPLRHYFERLSSPPVFLGRYSGNWRGHVARWEIFGNRLFLTGLFGMRWDVPPQLLDTLAPDPDPFEPEEDGVRSMRLPDLFPDQAPLVFAEWVTERLVVPAGPLLIYVHAGFGSLHSTYRTIDIAQGRVGAIRDWTAREWAQETGRDWLIEQLDQQERKALTCNKRQLAREEPGTSPDVNDWRNQSSRLLRWLWYEDAQRHAMHKPCGQRPAEESPAAPTTSPRPPTAVASG